MRTFYVYELVRKSDGKVIYVGKGTGRRMHMHHLFATNGHTKAQRKLYDNLSALIQSGDDFFARIVYDSADEAEVLRREVEIINAHGIDNLFNGVSSVLFGAVTSEKANQVRAKIRQSRKGMKFTAEHRKNISKALLARPPRSSAHRLNQSLGQLGKRRGPYKNRLSDEDRKHLRLAKYRRYYLKKKAARQRILAAPFAK